MPVLTAAGRRLDYRWIAPTRPGRPPLVFLHEGLGSVEAWRNFPDRVAAATGCGALVYSRAGYGRSEPPGAPWGTDYLHREALEALPAVLDGLAVAAPVLVGHSDGASIALIHAAESGRPVRGLVLEAPHLFVEDVTIAGIERIAAAFRATDLPKRLGRFHADADATFRAWSGIWLDPEFRRWNIEELPPRLRCPVLLIQGLDDEYGTLAQLDAVERRAPGPVERLELPGCGHSPHRDRPAETLAAMTRFIDRL